MVELRLDHPGSIVDLVAKSAVSSHMEMSSDSPSFRRRHGTDSQIASSTEHHVPGSRDPRHHSGNGMVHESLSPGGHIGVFALIPGQIRLQHATG